MRFLKIIYLFSKTNNETIKRKFYIANKFMAPGFPNKWVSPDKVFPISLTMVFQIMVFHWKWFSFEFSNGALQEIIRNTYHDLKQKYLQYNIWNLNGNMFTKLLWKINISWTLIPIYYVILCHIFMTNC